MVGVTGIEPVTPSMSTKCSPAELYALETAAAQYGPFRMGSINCHEVSFKGFCSAPPPPIVPAMTDALSRAHAPYDLSLPEDGHPVAAVFSSPHSGRAYPSSLLQRTHLSIAALRSSEDAFVEELFADAPAFGAPLMAARLPRAFVDLNRSADDLDPALIAGVPNKIRSPRINAGLGVIPRVVSDSRSIMHGKISMSEAKSRIRHVHAPYHTTLRQLMRQAREARGFAILFDCHSMPHDALVGSPLVNGVRPEIVLGDRFGASCDRWIMDAAVEIFSAAGFSVARNAPFAGGYITQAYGRPARNMHALQIEIDRSLYMNETNVAKRHDFGLFQKRIRPIVQALSGLGVEPLAIAAE